MAIKICYDVRAEYSNFGVSKFVETLKEAAEQATKWYDGVGVITIESVAYSDEEIAELDAAYAEAGMQYAK